ncbi:magnesium-transporting ATPase [Noviherbaspirillum denitrificans]|uniref:Magnesium-transporting ATPase, P-type 1 n=2 Tax=Noviherbaspirillum denitrificans TaxID=1968433 RepID=A0A254TEX3_9BURK|nr:magnesium-transporting ATPase [Noviherbaspirillum denitrificans]
MATLGSSAAGLTTQEAERRLALHGKNLLADTSVLTAWKRIIRKLASPLVLLLLFAASVSAATDDPASTLIIAAIILCSVLLDTFQEHRAGRAAEHLKRAVALRATALRNNRPDDILAENLVPGDIVLLHAGRLVPADGRIVTSTDLFVNEAALTGEPYPVEKGAALNGEGGALFMGTSVISGEAVMLVCETGHATRIGAVANVLATFRKATAFEQGVRDFGKMILVVVSLLVLFVTVTNLVGQKPLMESFLFALALAVGLTPELLPMIVTVTLARGALRLSRQRVIVKRLSAIQDLGAIDVLCTDKTGTLTEGAIKLIRHVDIRGRECEAVQRYAWLNSSFESGIRTALEEAILAHGAVEATGWTKLDEVPFDFERKRLSVLLAHGAGKDERRWLILKGAPDAVLSHCRDALDDPDDPASAVIPLEGNIRAMAQARLAELEDAGFRTLAVAVKCMPPDRDHARLDDEAGLTLAGFTAFFDPPKEGAAKAIRKLKDLGIDVNILTGDSERVTQYICGMLDVPVRGVLMGNEVAQLDDAALRERVRNANLFCRVSPMEKNRVIQAMRDNGRTVGYLGDGVNDAPALYSADVGISVDKAVDVAREAADLILLHHDLDVIAAGVVEGRRTFGNVRKYIMMGSSSNFGNMTSMAIAALYLPFLPMQPLQILLNNVLYDLSEATVPLDTVDRSETLEPQKWDMHFLRDFMLVMGPVSSLFDIATFYLMLGVFRLGETQFQTGWFVESLATQILVIFVIRTRKNPLKSRPHPALVAAAAGILAVAIALPLTPLADWFNFAPLPPFFYAAIAGLAILYLLLAQVMKQLFYAFRPIASVPSERGHGRRS